MFGRGWKPGQATIVTRRLVEQGHGGEGGVLEYQVFEYIADVRADDGMTMFRATIKEPLNAVHFRSPEVGQVVRVTFSEKDEHVKFDRDDPALHRDLTHRKQDEADVAAAHSSDAQERWDAVARATPGSAAPGAGTAGSSTAPTADEVKAANEAFQAASARASAVFQGFIEAKKSGDAAGIARAKADMPAANAEVQRCNAEIQRLQASR
jgi:hypothetical protein